jgi:hypothetical protein
MMMKMKKQEMMMLGLWAPSSGVEGISTSITYVKSYDTGQLTYR